MGAIARVEARRGRGGAGGWVGELGRGERGTARARASRAERPKVMGDRGGGAKAAAPAVATVACVCDSGGVARVQQWPDARAHSSPTSYPPSSSHSRPPYPIPPPAVAKVACVCDSGGVARVQQWPDARARRAQELSRGAERSPIAPQHPIHPPHPTPAHPIQSLHPPPRTRRALPPSPRCCQLPLTLPHPTPAPTRQRDTSGSAPHGPTPWIGASCCRTMHSNAEPHGPHGDTGRPRRSAALLTHKVCVCGRGWGGARGAIVVVEARRGRGGAGGWVGGLGRGERGTARAHHASSHPSLGQLSSPLPQPTSARRPTTRHGGYRTTSVPRDFPHIAAIAQLGERQTEDLNVPGSIPGLGRDVTTRCVVINTPRPAHIATTTVATTSGETALRRNGAECLSPRRAPLSIAV